jgi:putative MATE family efflux protein
MEPSVRRQVLALAWPAVLEQLLNMSVGLADTYIVGHLGAAPLAAVGLSIQSLNLFWALFGAIGVGSTALVARRIGAKEPEAAADVARQSIVLALFLGVLAAVVLWLGAPLLLDWLGAEPEVIDLGSAYLRAVASTVYMLSILFVGSAIMRGAGDTRTPMLVMLVINLVNIVVAYTLAYGVGPLPRLGVLGSGIGAATARGLGGLLILVLLMRGKGPVKIGRALACRPSESNC